MRRRKNGAHFVLLKYVSYGSASCHLRIAGSDEKPNLQLARMHGTLAVEQQEVRELAHHTAAATRLAACHLKSTGCHNQADCTFDR